MADLSAQLKQCSNVASHRRSSTSVPPLLDATDAPHASSVAFENATAPLSGVASPPADVASPLSGVTSPAADVASPSRRAWLGLSLAACGAALALHARPAYALANPDAQALAFLEELEALQSDFFTRATASAAADAMEPRERSIINLIARQDREHREWCRLARRKFGIAEAGHFSTSNAAQSRPPRHFTFPVQSFSTRGQLLPLAQQMKELAVGVYHTLLTRTDDADITEAVASLAGVESRHATILREIGGVNPLPAAFEETPSARLIAEKLATYGLRGETLL